MVWAGPRSKRVRSSTNSDPQESMTPITPLEPGVEMFQRGRPQSLFPIDPELANRLSIVPEVPTPSKFLALPASQNPRGRERPLSEVTEIYDYDSEEDESEFEEDSDEGLDFELVSIFPPGLLRLIFYCFFSPAY
jgi:hypothetical protein